MSVMNETSQSAMGPYSAMADAGFALKACTASFRESLLVKVRETASTVVARKSTGMRSVASFIVRPRCLRTKRGGHRTRAARAASHPRGAYAMQGAQRSSHLEQLGR